RRRDPGVGRGQRLQRQPGVPGAVGAARGVRRRGWAAESSEGAAAAGEQLGRARLPPRAPGPALPGGGAARLPGSDRGPPLAPRPAGRRPRISVGAGAAGPRTAGQPRQLGEDPPRAVKTKPTGCNPRACFATLLLVLVLVRLLAEDVGVRLVADLGRDLALE